MSPRIARGRLEGVVESREVRAQQLVLAETMGEPQILVGGDVAEIPRQRAHDLRVDALELSVREVLDQRVRPRAGVLEPVQDLRHPGGGATAV